MTHSIKHKQPRARHGFTVVELLIVIVTIGILAALSVVTYNGLQVRSQQAALISDLKNSSSLLSITRTKNGAYPTMLDDIAASNHLPSNEKISFFYTQIDNGSRFCLVAASSVAGVKSHIVSSDNLTPREGSCPGYADPNAPATSLACFWVYPITGGIELTGYRTHENGDTNQPACPKDMVIPSVANGQPVVQISDFSNKGLTSVVIPDSVTTMHYSTFENNQLQSVIIPSSITKIEMWTFRNNKLRSVTIPESVTKIGNGAFDNNELTSVKLPSSLTSIGEYSFLDNQLTSITIPDTITHIYARTFQNNQLTSVTLPNSLQYIATSAFTGNNLTSVNVVAGADVTWGAFDTGVTINRY